MKDQTIPTVVIDPEGVETLPTPKKHFWQKKYVLAIATAAAAVLAGAYILSKTAAEEEEESENAEESENPPFEIVDQTDKS